jgi:hypothetical protein
MMPRVLHRRHRWRRPLFLMHIFLNQFLSHARPPTTSTFPPSRRRTVSLTTNSTHIYDMPTPSSNHTWTMDQDHVKVPMKSAIASLIQLHVTPFHWLILIRMYRWLIMEEMIPATHVHMQHISDRSEWWSQQTPALLLHVRGAAGQLFSH